MIILLFIAISEMKYIIDMEVMDEPTNTQTPNNNLTISNPKVFIPITIALIVLIVMIIVIIVCFRKNCPSCLPCLLC